MNNEFSSSIGPVSNAEKPIHAYSKDEKCKCGAVVDFEHQRPETLLMKKVRTSDGSIRTRIMGCSMCDYGREKKRVGL